MVDHAYFLSKEAQSRAKGIVQSIESGSRVEVVVSVRARSDEYPEGSERWGFLGGFAVLLLLLFHPREFSVRVMPFNVLLAFAIAYVAAKRIPELSALLVRKKRKKDLAKRAAHSAFFSLGVGRTAERIGLLVYVSLQERSVVVLPDQGIAAVALGSEWEEAVARVEQSLDAEQPSEEFFRSLEALGPILSLGLPRRENDRNELPDEPRVLEESAE